MDKDVADKMYRIVGNLETLDELAKRACGMPNDTATAAIIVAIRTLTDSAVRSAWLYANTETTPSASAP